MNDFHDLSDAFDELERRADAAPSRSAALTTPRASHRARPLLIAASSVAVLAVAVTVAVTASGDGSPTQRQAGGPGTVAASSASVGPPPAGSVSPPSAAAQAIPTTSKELEALFAQVLDGVATFTVTDTGAAIVGAVPSLTRAPTPTTPTPTTSRETTDTPPVPTPVETTPAVQSSGAAIVGILTSGGLTGGYDIQIYQDSPGTKVQCDDPGASSCSVRTLTNGSSLATGSEPLQDGGVTYQAAVVRPDGTTILMHVSNDRDPKGAGGQSAPRPPLTIEQMTAIVTSPFWPPR